MRMTDIVERLKERSNALGRAEKTSKAIDDLGVHLMLAANEIERLRAALNEIAAFDLAPELIEAWQGHEYGNAMDIARDALNQSRTS